MVELQNLEVTRIPGWDCIRAFFASNVFSLRLFRIVAGDSR